MGNGLRRFLPWLLLLLWFQLLSSALPPVADEIVYLDHAWHMMQGRSPRGDYSLEDMRLYARYPAAPSLWWIPSALVAWAFTGVTAYSDTHPPMAWWLIRLGGSALATLTVAGFAWWLRAVQLVRRPTLWAFIAVAGTTIWWYSRTFFSESLLVAAIVGALAASYRIGRGDARWPTRALLILCLLVVPNTKLTAGWIYPAAWLLASRGGGVTSHFREALWFGAAGVASIAGFLGYNWVKFDDPLYFGYQEQGFTAPWWAGFLGLTLSPGRGLFWYSPLLLAAVWGFPRLAARDALLAWVIGGAAFIHLALHGAWWVWAGGWCWGPRLALPVFPLLALPAVIQLAAMLEQTQRALARFAAIGLVVLSLGLQLPGVLFNHLDFQRIAWMNTEPTYPAGRPTRDAEMLLHWIPELSPLRGHLWFVGLAWTKTKPLDSSPPWAALGYEPWEIRHPESVPPVDWWAMEFLGQRNSRTGMILFLLVFAGGCLAVCWHQCRTGSTT
jgi:hypothetical protein